MMERCKECELAIYCFSDSSKKGRGRNAVRPWGAGTDKMTDNGRFKVGAPLHIPSTDIRSPAP
jgi:hypothetical protein